ncbi:MAG TPA: glycoside hydrolase family 130 protein [Hanamia sp.]|nr:glycoside hydrolase family 130 protein [Hanamia sp.]
MISKTIKTSWLKFSFAVIISFFFFAVSSNAQSPNTLPSWAFGGFVRPENINPIISPDSTAVFIDPMSGKKNHWESDNTFNPAATIKDGKAIVLYRAEDNSGNGIGFHTSRIGFAESNDGLYFKRKRVPVLFPANDSQKEFEWPGGCEDPRVAVTENGMYVMFYTQWNRKIPRLGVATSTDLIHWKKYGPTFQKAYNGRFFNMATKSASILTKMIGDKQVITKINGKYWLYWGEHHVYAATSSDLINWQPVLNKDGKLKELISPRKGFFDSDLTECGPPALITKNGILLFYNGKNKSGDEGDKRYNADSYCAGQVLFDLKDPSKPIARLDVPFLRPMEPFEKSGQYVNGTVFIEGMVFLKKKWYLYYGCADSRVGVAVYDPSHPAPGDPVILK